MKSSKLDTSFEPFYRLITPGPVKTLPSSRRIRLLLNGKYIADTTSALFVWEHDHYPVYYLPEQAFTRDAMFSIGLASKHDGDALIGRFQLHNIDTDVEESKYVHSIEKGVLKGYYRVPFDAVDAWFEEDTQIFVHPKDPFKRVDILHSSRKIKVTINNRLVAVTNSSMHLYETGLPTRYYIPLTAIDQTCLQKSDSKSQCPYKGEAEYWSVVLDGQVFKDVAWYYARPTLECAAIQDMVCFYAEKDGVQVDLEEA